MTLPLIDKFRNIEAPQAPAFYVDTGPEGEHIDAILAAGSVAVLEKIKDVVEAAEVDQVATEVVTGDIQYRIDISNGDIKPHDGDEEMDPVVLQGPEAQFVARTLYDIVKGKNSKVGFWQKLRTRNLVRHMLEPNQIPVMDQIDPEYEALVAQARVLASPPLVVDGKKIADIPVIIPTEDDWRTSVQ
jgi:hypothetical protein